jgi:hypothetical protein
MRYLLIFVLAGCSMTTDQMRDAKLQCEAAGMGVSWFVVTTGQITAAQCLPKELKAKK